jgi:RNA polymerase sigma-70 factor (ECF subfamily)
MWATPIQAFFAPPPLCGWPAIPPPVVVAHACFPAAGRSFFMPCDDKIVLQSFARSIVRRKARLLVGRAGFTAQDVRDLEQELLLRLLKSLPRFDPEQAHVNVFVTTVVERSVAMLLRERRAKKRAAAVRSLDALAADGGPAEPPDHRDGGRDAERSDLAYDLAEVLSALPAGLRDLAERLKERTVSQAARDLNVPRTTLLRQVERLRRCFEDAGLRIYL